MKETILTILKACKAKTRNFFASCGSLERGSLTSRRGGKLLSQPIDRLADYPINLQP